MAACAYAQYAAPLWLPLAVRRSCMGDAAAHGLSHECPGASEQPGAPGRRESSAGTGRRTSGRSPASNHASFRRSSARRFASPKFGEQPPSSVSSLTRLLGKKYGIAGEYYRKVEYNLRRNGSVRASGRRGHRQVHVRPRLCATEHIVWRATGEPRQASQNRVIPTPIVSPPNGACSQAS